MRHNHPESSMHILPYNLFQDWPVCVCFRLVRIYQNAASIQVSNYEMMAPR